MRSFIVLVISRHNALGRRVITAALRGNSPSELLVIAGSAHFGSSTTSYILYFLRFALSLYPSLAASYAHLQRPKPTHI
jgi:hypothetical protein